MGWRGRVLRRCCSLTGGNLAFHDFRDALSRARPRPLSQSIRCAVSVRAERVVQWCSAGAVGEDSQGDRLARWWPRLEVWQLGAASGGAAVTEGTMETLGGVPVEGRAPDIGQALAALPPAGFRRLRSLPAYRVTPEWVLHQLWQHEAEPRGHIALLRSWAEGTSPPL